MLHERKKALVNQAPSTHVNQAPSTHDPKPSLGRIHWFANFRKFGDASETAGAPDRRRLLNWEKAES
jgi:hypothetical protein